MTSEQFDNLVNRVQARYGTRPLALRFRIAILVVVGYAGFVALLMVVLLIAAGLILGAFLGGKEPSIFLLAMVSVLLPFAFAQLAAFLWVPIESEKSRELTRGEVPALFDLLDSLRVQLGAKPFDHVRIDPDLNASVQVIPRLGVFGWNRSYLTLGLPLMRVLSPEQFSSVLAHEFAHSVAGHDRFGTWIYRLRQTWSRVFAELHNPSSSSLVSGMRRTILWFVDWFWPRFNAYAFVLSRSNEYEADRKAAEWAGVETTVAALFRIECFSNRMKDRFWEEIRQRAKTEPRVADDYVDFLERFFLTPPTVTDANRWLDLAAQGLTGNVDTHPSLADRLKSLGISVTRFTERGFPGLPAQSADRTLLGNAFRKITDDVNREWQQANELSWQGAYHEARRLEKRLEATADWNAAAREAEPESRVEVSVPPPSAEIDAEKLWRHIRTVWELQGANEAVPLLRQFLAVRPTHAGGNATLGSHLLANGDVDGEIFLRRILDEEDNELIPTACELLAAHFQKRGQGDRVREIRERLSRFETAKAAAGRERGSVTPADTFIPHGLSECELESLQQSLRSESESHSAWLVQKRLTHFKNQRLFVLVGHTSPTGFFRRSNSDLDQALTTRLINKVNLPGRVLIIAPHGGFRPLARKIMAIPGARVFAADASVGS